MSKNFIKNNITKEPIAITAIASISPYGFASEVIENNYPLPQHFLSKREGNWVGALSEETRQQIRMLRYSNSKYKQLDDSVLFGIFASRIAIHQAGWTSNDYFGINIGSSRGATALFERYHQQFLKQEKAEVLSSPTTTLGNISSWIAHDLQSKGPEISHSITCSTALHALLNGIAWLKSGLCEKFLVGGSEAPLTPFTIAQMQALKIYTKQQDDIFPCKALDLNKSNNTMVLSEAAAVACLELGKPSNALAYISGFGFGTELLVHNTSLSSHASCFQKSMQMALGSLPPKAIDIIITHTPGTIKGDLAEYNAIKTIFGNTIPALTTNKYQVGHSLGASGMLSIAMAIFMLQKKLFLEIPFLKQKPPKRISNIMVNAVGFGGNAVSVVISEAQV